jgi:hypothetical protein
VRNFDSRLKAEATYHDWAKGVVDRCAAINPAFAGRRCFGGTDASTLIGVATELRGDRRAVQKHLHRVPIDAHPIRAIGQREHQRPAGIVRAPRRVID